MKKMFRLTGITAAFLFVFMTLGCASKKGELQEITDEAFSPKIVLIASGSERLVKFEIDKNELIPGINTSAVQASSIEISIFSGRKPANGGSAGTPVATITFDLLKDADRLLKGYDLMANEKELKISAADLNSKLKANQYYYARGKFEATVKEDKLVTKTKTLYSNDTVYTPVEE